MLKPLIPSLALILAMASTRGDDFVQCPTPPGQVGGPTEIASAYPFAAPQTVRYQQVYDSSQFASVSPTNIYISTLEFEASPGLIPPCGYTPVWTVTNMQIDLSTTPRGPDGLSPVFTENVGADDEVVFGPRASPMFGGCAYSRQSILLDRPFRYNPALGNLLLDVRVFGGAHSSDGGPVLGAMLAYSSPTDTVSRVWASSVTASTADQSDTIGLFTVVQFSPVPSLHVFTSRFLTPTNYVVVEWPLQPSAFQLQWSARLGAGANWQTLTNAGQQYTASTQWYISPADTAGSSRFFRLVWPGGY